MPFICLFVCLSVCLLATLHKNYWTDLHKIFTTKSSPQTYLCTRKNWLNFGSRTPPDPHPGIFWRILQHCEIGHFYTIWLVSPERAIGFWWQFCHTCILGRVKSLLNFGSNPDPESRVQNVVWIQSLYPDTDSGSGLSIWIWTPDPDLLSGCMQSLTALVVGFVWMCWVWLSVLVQSVTWKDSLL